MEVFVFLFLIACGGENKVEDKLPAIIAALDVAALTGVHLRDEADLRGDQAACVAWSAVAAAAPVASEVLVQVSAGKVTEIPGVEWDASRCTTVNGIDGPGMDRVKEYVGLAVATARHIVEAWRPAPQYCVAHAVADAAVAFVNNVHVPVLAALDSGILAVKVAPTPIMVICPDE